MQTKIVKRFHRILPILLCLTACLTAMFSSIKAEASWIDRDASGIYADGDFGQGIGDIDEDDMAEEEEIDEGTGFFVQMFETIFIWLFRTIGNLLFGILDLIGASLDVLIYGRLVRSDTLFTFDLGTGNVYGIVSAAVYGILSTGMIVLLIPVFMGKIAVSAWKRGDVAKATLKEAISYFAFALLLILLMPYLLDVCLFLRDCLLYLIGTEAASNLFGTNNATSIVAVLSAAANENIISAVLYVIAVVLNVYFLIGYVGIALSMAANFILFPVIVMKMAFERQVLKNWVWEMISCMMVPLIDALLIMIPSFIGIYASELTGMDTLGITIVQLIICYMTIPIRMYARGIIGIRANPLENTGLTSAKALLGAAGGLAVKRAFDSSRDAKKNAEADRERAELEEDLAKLEQEEKERQEALAASRLENADLSTLSADELKHEAQKKAGIMDADDFSSELEEKQREKYPLGEEQSYAKGLEARILSEEEELKDVPLPKEAALDLKERQKNAKKREALDEELVRSKEELDELNDLKGQILNDDSLSTEEKEKKLRDLERKIAQKGADIKDLKEKRDDLLTVDDKIREANNRKTKLEEEWHSVANDAGIPQREKEEKLNAINDQIKDVSDEIDVLQKQKNKMHLQHEKEALLSEPATLRRELESLKAERPSIDGEMDELIRSREKLLEKQAEYSAGTDSYRELDKQIRGLNERIASREASLSDNLIRQNTINAALKKQESTLFDRQAYNLHERVKAQDEYDRAEADAKFHKKRLEDADAENSPLLAKGTAQRKHVERQLEESKERMKKAKNRISDLSMDDRKIAERLNEVTQKTSPYTLEDLKEAKNEQAVKRAKIQKEIADTQYEMKLNGDNNGEHQVKIAKLQSEVADCNYKSARLDQLMEGLKGSAGGSKAASFVTDNTRAARISGEYEKRRAAIMERYANIDNFESPAFSGISRERKAELYRERAMRTQKIFTSRKVSGVLGATLGATSLLWLGSSGVTTGAIMGGAIGAEFGENAALRSTEKVVKKPANYKDTPREFQVLSDVRDVTEAGYERTYLRVKAELRDSLSTKTFEDAVREELLSSDLVRTQIKDSFRRNRINKDNYEAKREMIVAEVNEKIIETVENAKGRIVTRCAGSEYAKLGGSVKKKILDEVGVPNRDVFTELTDLVYLEKKWKPHYEDYLSDD